MHIWGVSSKEGVFFQRYFRRHILMVYLNVIMFHMKKYVCVCVCVWNNCELPEHSFLNSFFHWVNQFSKYAFTLMFNLPHQQLGIKNVVGNLTWLKFSTSYHRTKIAVFSDFKSMLITFAIQFNVHLSPRTCLELISFGKSRLQ